MKGKVTGRVAKIHVTFRLPGLPDLSVECTIDTGFEGYLTLPQAALTAMGLTLARTITAKLADGTSVQCDIYLATIVWNGKDILVEVIAMGQQPLLGTALLVNCRLGIDFVDNGDVVVLPRP